MTGANVELVRSTFRPGDPSRFFDLLAEEFEFDSSAYPLPDCPNVVRGKDLAIRCARPWRRWGRGLPQARRASTW